ncbi:MAG TPA: MBOAT family protein [Gemmataceae bacterium]|nr:MBOAT family protein [Gemmataceae bacterium]
MIQFFSREFLIFFGVVFVVYWLTPWRRLRVWVLLTASFVFYASWDWRLAILITGTTAADYFIARGMDAWIDPRRRKLLLVGSLVMNLGLLCYFKYANFFLNSLGEGLNAAGTAVSLPVLRVILPIGISFYTFEAINYTVDVYRRRVPAERNFGHFMLFILFFPHLIAGPIVRARDFLPQVARRKRWDWARMQLGVSQFLVGLLKKLAIADRMALYARPVFEDPEGYGSRAVWLATLAFALQIYADFSGYTDMALGSANLLGFKLAPNFNMPYLATNFSDFWRRWHISLSSWLRDYLFIPLGGSRGSGWKICRNLMITMTLGGLWHGLSWVYVLWGVLHGGFLVMHRSFRSFCEARPRLDWVLRTPPGTALRRTVTFLGVCVGWVLFAAAGVEAEATLARFKQLAAGEEAPAVEYDALHASGVMLGKLVVPEPGPEVPHPHKGLWLTLAAVALCHGLTVRGLWKKVWRRLPAPALGFGYAAILTLALALAPEAGQGFIYFQF